MVLRSLEVVYCLEVGPVFLSENNYQVYILRVEHFPIYEDPLLSGLPGLLPGACMSRRAFLIPGFSVVYLWAFSVIFMGYH